MKAWYGVCFTIINMVSTVVYGDPYEFPITSADSLTIEERLDAMQVPESILTAMTTLDVYLTTLVPTFTFEYLLSSSGPQHGFDRFLCARYNIFNELLGRDDITEVLVEQYLAVVIDETTCSDRDYQRNRSLTELILSQYDIIDRLTFAEKQSLVDKAYSILEFNKIHPDLEANLGHTSLLLGRIMLCDAYSPLMDQIAIDPEIEYRLLLGFGDPVIMELVPGYVHDISG